MRLLCSVEAAPIYSGEIVLALALGVAATALLLGLLEVLVGTAVPEDRTTVEVAVAWRTVRVIVVVEASDAVVFCARTEGARMTAIVAMAALKRILMRRMSSGMEVGSRSQSRSDLRCDSRSEQHREIQWHRTLV